MSFRPCHWWLWLVHLLTHFHSIVDINNALVDDGLVDKEKIGGSNYFWSFPGKADRRAQLEHEARLQALTQLEQDLCEAQQTLQDAQRGRQDDDGVRAQNLLQLAQWKREQASLSSELETLKENDPQVLEDLEHELKLVTEAAHRWTDNIFNCQSYLVKKRGMDKKEVNKILGITSAFACECGWTTSAWKDNLLLTQRSLLTDPEDKVPKGNKK